MFYKNSSYDMCLIDKLYLYLIKKSIVLPKEKSKCIKNKIHVF